MNKEYKNSKQDNRESNFELLRIISIILIIFFHCKASIKLPNELSINRFILVSTGSWGILGVDCFFLISSYFFIKKARFKSKKLFNIIIQTVFYFIPFFVLYVIYETCYKNNGTLINNIFNPIYKGLVQQPLFSNTYWFITIYIFLYLSFQFMNDILFSISIKKLKKILTILSIIILIYSNARVSYTLLEDYSYVIYIYILQFYLCQNKNNWFERNAKLGFCLCTIVIMFAVFIQPKITIFNDLFSCIFANTDRHSTIILLDSIFLFYIFKNIKINYSKMINFLSSRTLGLYLFHEFGYLPLRTLILILFCDFMKCSNLNMQWYMFIFYFVEVLALFIIGILVDWIREKIMKIIYDKKIYNNLSNVIYKLDKFINEQ